MYSDVVKINTSNKFYNSNFDLFLYGYLYDVEKKFHHKFEMYNK